VKAKALTALAIVVFLAALWLVSEQGDNCITGYEETNCQTIQEDDPRWNCETMGNLICGKDAG